MAEDQQQEALLLKLQADTAAGVTAMQEIVKQLGEIAKSSTIAAEAMQKAARGTSEATQGFSDQQAKLVTLASAYTLFKGILGDVQAIYRQFARYTIDVAVAFGRQAQELQNVQRSLGVTTGFYQQLQRSLESVGLSAESARTALFFFTRAVQGAREGNDKLSATFRAWKVDLTEGRPIDEILLDTVRGLNTLTSVAERNTVAQELFSRSAGRAMVPALKEIGEAGSRSRAELEALGLVLTNRELAQGLAFDKVHTEIDQLTHAIKDQLGAAMAKVLLPDMIRVEAAMREGAKAVKDHREQTEGLLAVLSQFSGVSTVMNGIILLEKAFTAAAAGAERLKDALKTVIDPGWVDFAYRIIGGYFGIGAAAKDAADQVTAAQHRLELEQQGKQFGHRGDTRGLMAAATGGFAFNPAEQLKITEAEQAQAQARRDASAAETGRLQGQIAGLQAQYKAALDASRDQFNLERDKAAKEGPIKGQIDATTAAAIDKREKAAQAAIDSNYNEQLAAAREQVGRKMATTDIEIYQNAEQTKIDIAKRALETRRQLNQISDVEYYTQLRALIEREGTLRVESAQKQLAVAGPDDQAAARAKVLAARNEQTKNLIDNADAMTVAAEKAVDAQAKLQSQVDALVASTAGDERSAQIIRITEQWRELVKALQDAHLDDEVAKVNAAYKQMIADVDNTTIHVGDTIAKLGTDAFSGITLGTRKLSDVFNGLKDAAVSQASSMFGGMLAEKFKFDVKFKKNFLEDLPQSSSKGFTDIAQQWSNLASLMSGGSGQGATASIGTTGGTIGGQVQSLQSMGQLINVLSSSGGEAGTIAGAGAPVAEGAAAGAAGGAGGTGGTAAAGGSTLALSGAAGGATLGVGLVAGIATTIFADAVSKHQSMKALETALVSLFVIPILGQVLLIVWGLLKAFGLFEMPTHGTLLKTQLQKELTSAGVPMQRDIKVSGRKGVRTPGIETALTEADRQRWIQEFGIDPERVGKLGSLDNQTQDVLKTKLTAAAAAHPATAATAFTSGAALGFGTGQGGQDAAVISQAFTNNMLLLGMSAQSTKRYAREVLDKAGLGDVIKYFDELNRKIAANRMTQEQATAAVKAAADAYSDDFVKAVDVATLAQTAMNDQGILDTALITERLDRAKAIYESFNQKGAVGAAFGPGGSQAYAQTLKQQYGQSVQDMATKALTDNPAYQAIFANTTTELTLAGEALKSGDWEKANTLFKDAGTQWTEAVDHGKAFIDAFLAANPEIQKTIDDFNSMAQATDMVKSALDSVFSKFAKFDDAARTQQETRIQSLENSIELAKMYGDTLAQAELEGQLAAEKANQERMGGKDAGADFIKALQQQMREAVVAAIVQGLVDSAGIQDKIAPFLSIVREQAARVTADPSQAADAKSIIENAWQDVKNSLDQNTAVMNLLAPYLTQLQFAHGGQVPGRPGRAVPITAHAGEYVLSVEQLAALSAAIEAMMSMSQGPQISDMVGAVARGNAMDAARMGQEALGVGGKGLAEEMHFHFEGDCWASPDAQLNVRKMAEALIDELKMQGILDTA